VSPKRLQKERSSFRRTILLKEEDGNLGNEIRKLKHMKKKEPKIQHEGLFCAAIFIIRNWLTVVSKQSPESVRIKDNRHVLNVLMSKFVTVIIRTEIS